ncbi:MAG: amidohydrolase family protein [Bacteroidota bacterium]
MSAAKGESITIITNGHVITCDAQGRGGRLDLLIRDGRIMEVSDRPDLFSSLHPYATIVDASGKLIIPGFVNAHFHSESILLRERTAGLHFSLWKRDLRLREASQKLLSEESYADIRSLYQIAYFSHMKSGTTCVGEFPLPFNDKAFVQLLQAIDRTDVKAVVALQNWDQIRQAKELGAGAARFMLNLGKEEDFTVYTFDNLLRAANEHNLPTVAHVAEQREDAEIIRKNFQKNVLTVLREYNALQQTSLAVHLNHITDAEVDAAVEAGLSVAISPYSSARKQTGYPSLRALISRGVPCCLSTDWENTDMLTEMQFLHQLPLVLPSMQHIAPLDILRMATINGAVALGVGSETGSIEAGKKADLTFFSLRDVRIPPVDAHATTTDLAELLLDDISSRNISDVMIDGEFYLSNHHLMTIDEEELIEDRRVLHSKFFPSSKMRASRIEEDTTRPRIIPFVLELKKPGIPLEGFEEGFSVLNTAPPPQSRSSEPEQREPMPRRVPESSASGKPQLPKDVKKVFGEDDEF